MKLTSRLFIKISETKGERLVVILNKVDYIDKVLDFINKPGFSKLKSNPTISFQKLVRATVYSHRDILSSLNINYRTLLQMNPVCPLLYGLPKIHKCHVPIRPVVSFIDTPISKITAWLNYFLKLHVKLRHNFSLENARQLTERISSAKLPTNFAMVSFDVENLFPSIPPHECIQLVSEHLTTSDLLDHQVACVLSLLNLCLKQNFFKFNNTCYSQIGGLAMGSNLSPFLSEIFMNNLEVSFISKHQFYHDHVIYWGRYVDDVVCIHSGNDLKTDLFLQYLNNIHPCIKFTMEKETNGSLPFLDLLLLKSPAKISFSIYRKPTTTDTLIPIESEHSFPHKLASLNSLIHRLFSIPMSPDSFNNELNIIKQIAINNGYPAHLVAKLASKIKYSRSSSRLTPIAAHSDYHMFKSLPFYPHISYKIQNIFKHHNIFISFSNNHTLRSSIVRNKDRSDPLDSSGVYQLNCNSCPSFYIGQTGRSFRTRFKEHFNAIKRNNMDHPSSMAEHILSTGHSFDYKQDFKILHRVNKGYLLNTLENFEISRHKLNPGLLNEIVDFQNVLISNLCI
ncbi:hypothetical protein RI129_010804 [Pyrocoelia pectoralis]|uniref:Reverse transcriptase domain-containing protein n=1 Tax=Pyrocoelia pectoralis TaxID=417401 RepID=A0AAN7V6P0_9COLE